jgi:Protein of unknown function (DUF3109)
VFLIQDKLLSEALIETHFVCNLDACKGACCWEGDAGAPLEAAELPVLAAIYEKTRPFLTEKGIAAIESQGTAVQSKIDGSWETPLIDNAACAYMTLDESGKAGCGIEQAFRAGAHDFQKPISCHLYPIRVSFDERIGFEALNYDKWSICAAACTFGKSLKVPVYQFLKEPIIRKYGPDFYEELDGMAEAMREGALK